MRTTVNIDNDLLRTAKQYATAEGKSLSSVVTESLREHLARRKQTTRTVWEPVTLDQGKVMPGVDLTDNVAVRDLMDNV